MSSHLANHIHHSELNSDNTLHVIGVLTNVVRWHSRYRLARAWIKEMEATPNVKLHLVEAAFKDRKFEVTEACNPNHLQVHTHSEIWLKENLINLGVKHLLPKDWKYMAWVDMDVSFEKKDWAQETIHQLQHYNIIQPWSHCIDMDHHGGILSQSKSFGFLCANRVKMTTGRGCPGYEFAHTGYAWACTRYFYENVEKLWDAGILGAGDHTMAWACVGNVSEAINQDLCEGYYGNCEAWQAKALRACGGLVGYLHGTVKHYFHGAKVNRQYWTRWGILVRNHFNPNTDLGYNSKGVLVLIGKNKLHLEHDAMIYNRQRREDSIDY